MTLAPAMSAQHLEAVWHYLESYPAPTVLEWGCGGSTVHLVRKLAESGRTFRWIAIEHSSEWERRVAAEVDGLPVEILRHDKTEIVSGPLGRSVRVPTLEYVNRPLSLGLRFDLILVDGRRRARCIAVAREVLAPGGVILLHDAQRHHYHKACEGMVTTKITDAYREELWVLHA